MEILLFLNIYLSFCYHSSLFSHKSGCFPVQVMNLYIAVAEAKKDEESKKVLREVRDSPSTIEQFMKAFDYRDSKFKTMCHSDLWTSQIMFCLNEDGWKPSKLSWTAPPPPHLIADFFQIKQKYTEQSIIAK